MLPSLARHNPMVVHFSKCTTALYSSLSLLLLEWAFFGFFVWLFTKPHDAGTYIHLSGFATRFCFVKLTLGRMQIFRKRWRANAFSNYICRVVKEWHHGYFRHGYFFSSTHFDLVTSRALKRLCVLFFCARSLLS